MPSTYTSRLRLTLPATGELINTWGTTVNTGITELVDASIAGAATISTWGGAGVAYTLSNSNGVADEARCMFIVASGAPGENKNIICPAVTKLYVVANNVTGGYTVTLKTAAGTGITVENGKTAILRCDGTNVVDAITQLPAFVVAGGTTNGVVYLNASKVLTTGSALTFDGTNLGIGTSSPGYKLQVAGAGTVAEIVASNTTGAERIHLLSRSSAGVSYVQSQNAQLLVGTLDNYAMQFMTNNTSRMLLDTSGNLGIGTSSPATKLHVNTGAAGYGITVAASTQTSRTYQLGVDLNSNFAIYDSTAAAQRVVLDASGNLGLGVTPSAWGSNFRALELQYTSGGSVVAGQYPVIAANTYNDNSNWLYKTTAAASYYSQVTGQHRWYTAPSGTAGNAISFTQAMTLTAAGLLGVGTTSPQRPLHAYESSAAVGGYTMILESYVGGYGAGVSFQSILGGSSTLAEMARITADGETAWNTVASNQNAGLRFYTTRTGAASEKMRLDSSGNLGLGVTPSAATSFKMLQMPAGGIVATQGNSVAMASNAVYNSGWKYAQTAAASYYSQDTGAHGWFTAPSGTAGNAITFTQAMTLGSSGNLGIGNTSPSYPLDIARSFSVYGAHIYNSNTSTDAYNTLILTGASSGMPAMMIGAGGTTVTNASLQGVGYVGTQNNTPLVFLTNDIGRARITSGGDLLVGTTSVSGWRTSFIAATSGVIGCSLFSVTEAADYPVGCVNEATSGDNNFVWFLTEAAGSSARGSIDYNRAGGLVRYNTTSDYRAKDIIGPVQNPGATIDALKVYEGVMKGATQARPMLVAHEAQAHAPYAVSGVKDDVNEDGTPKFQQMDVSSLVPLLLAEIQSLRARVAALEAA